jgi:enoyl-CoA hydratase/carnithine racemase
VRFEVHDGIATITLDSPDNRNALSTLLVAQLREAMSAAIADPDVRAVVLTGAGPVFLRRCGLAGAAGPLAPPGTTRVQGLGFRAFDDNRGFFDDNRHDESSPTCSNKCPSSRGRHAPTTAE